MKINVKAAAPRTAEGGAGVKLGAEAELKRAIMACMLFEGTFYESGVDIAERVKQLVPKTRPEFAAAVAYHARTDMKVRHAPLLVMREMARHPSHRGLLSRLIPDVIQRPDEMTDLLALYWKEGKKPLAAQLKRGLAKTFLKFDQYQLAKYNRDGAVKLRDVLFMTHAKPNTPEQEAVWKALVDGTLEAPDTWEVALSAGADKKETFERLMAERKLLQIAFLRNLRNMQQAGIGRAVVRAYGDALDFGRTLPFQFIAAARAVPTWEDIIEPWMLKCLDGQEKVGGKTALLIDVSGSMDSKISAKSELTRLDAACGLAIVAREHYSDINIFTFSTRTVEVAPRRGFALAEAIVKSQPHGRTYLGKAVNYLRSKGFERLIVMTDEQSHDAVTDPGCKHAYMVNVATNKTGVGYGKWTHIDGWSEAIIRYIDEFEHEEN